MIGYVSTLRADLVIVRGDVMKDISATQNIEKVFSDGKAMDTSFHANYRNPIPRPMSDLVASFSRGRPVFGHTLDIFTAAANYYQSVEHSWSVVYTSIQDPKKKNDLDIGRMLGKIDTAEVHAHMEPAMFDKIINVALGIAEFAAKPGLKGKSAQSLTDMSLARELEQAGFFAASNRVQPEHGKRAE